MSATNVTNSSEKDGELNPMSVCDLMVQLSSEMYEGIEGLGIISDDSRVHTQRIADLQAMILTVRVAMQNIKVQADKSRMD